MTDEYGDEYRAGWKEGYEKGNSDGVAVGYSDARYRTWLAIDVLRDAGKAAAVVRSVEDAVTNIVGKRA